MKRLAQERSERRLTQRDVAERIGLSYNSLFKIEQGRLIPGPLSATAARLERFFGYRLRTLLADI